MNRKHIVVVGTNFGGYTGAIELKELVGGDHDITVIANTHKFTFFPSFIWYPFGLREEKDITFDVRPIYDKHNIRFIETTVTHFDPEKNLVYTNSTEPISYDYILAKTAVKNIVADMNGQPHVTQSFEEMKAYCILDTGNMGMMIVGDHMMEPRKHQLIIPGPEAHWAKLGFEKYFLASRKHGHV